MILALRINKAILKCTAIVVGINLKPDLNSTDKPSAEDNMPSARQNYSCFFAAPPWQQPPMGQLPQLPPQEDLPCFLSFTMALIIKNTITANIRLIIIVAGIGFSSLLISVLLLNLYRFGKLVCFLIGSCHKEYYCRQEQHCKYNAHNIAASDK